MTRVGLETRVGLTVVIAAAILVFGTMWFQRFQLTENRWDFFVRFEQVGGLITGDPVMVNGVEAGRVEGIDLREDMVVARMGVREGVTLRADSRIQLKSIGIMGERFVAITQGTSAHYLEPGDTTGGEFLMSLSEVMGEAGRILDEVADASRQLNDLLTLLNEEGRLKTTMENLADVSTRLRDITDENQPQLARAIDRFDNVATLMDSMLTRHYASLDSSVAAMGRSGPRFEEAVANFETVSKNLREISDALGNGEGTLGRLLTDEDMALKLENTIAGLDSLVADIKRHPGRYVSFSLF